MNQLYVYKYPPPSWASLPPPYPTPQGQHRGPSWTLRYTAICFTHCRVYMSMQLSQFGPSSPSPSVSTSLLWMSVSLFLPCKWVHQYHFSSSHMHVLISDICFTFWLTSLCMTLDWSFIHGNIYFRAQAAALPSKTLGDCWELASPLSTFGWDLVL